MWKEKSESNVTYRSQFQINFSFFNIASELEDLIYQNDLQTFCFGMISNFTDYGKKLVAFLSFNDGGGNEKWRKSSLYIW